MYKRLELHNHTNESDGVFTCKELTDFMVADQVDAFALTDHNTCQKIRNLKSYQNYRSVERIGALAPGSTKEGLIADLAFIPGFLVIILGTYVFNIPDPVMLICMWITMVSFYGHFVLNGRVYKFLHKRKVIRYRKVKEESAEKNTQLKEGV